MKFILHGCFIIILSALLPITSSAQDITIVDTSSPQDPLIEPAIVMTPVTVEPSCHTYTGCGLIVLEKVYYQKPKVYKHKRNRIYHQPCCDIGNCYVRPVTENCY